MPRSVGKENKKRNHSALLLVFWGYSLNAGKFIKDFSQSWSWILDLGLAVVVMAALSRES